MYSARDVSAKLSSCCFLSSRLAMWQPQLSINLQQQGLLNLRQWVSWMALEDPPSGIGRSSQSSLLFPESRNSFSFPATPWPQPMESWFLG